MARMKCLEQLRLWVDPVARLGPAAMAVDEWLLETTAVPVLRVYRWQGDWGTIGYFGALSEARASFPGVEWVRRWTGGGTVDHRSDWTYTVVVPSNEGLARCRGAESYRLLHAALAAALVEEGIHAWLSSGAEATGFASCFENPVSHDLVGPDGRKLAGAGQRRTRRGLLHQGSVAAPASGTQFGHRAQVLSGHLAKQWSAIEFDPPTDIIDRKIADRYGRQPWTERR